jgi:hypothetical protein
MGPLLYLHQNANIHHIKIVPANGASLPELGDTELADDVAVGDALVDRRRARSVQTDGAVQDVHQYCGSHFRHCSSKRS